MATLQTLWVIHTTSTAANADTDEGFDLVIRTGVPASERARIRFPDLPHDERERGRTDEYRFDLRTFNIEMTGLRDSNICIQIRGDDAWLPSTIWVIGQDVTGAWRLLVHVPAWPSNRRFSTNSSEGATIRCLDEPTRFPAARASQ